MDDCEKCWPVISLLQLEGLALVEVEVVPICLSAVLLLPAVFELLLVLLLLLFLRHPPPTGTLLRAPPLVQ